MSSDASLPSPFFTMLTTTHLATRPTMQSKLVKRTSLSASHPELDAKLELLQQLGYGDRYIEDDASLSEKASFDTDRWIRSEYSWALEEAAESNVHVPDLFDGQFRASSPSPVASVADSQHTSQLRKTKSHVCRTCMTRPSSLPQCRRLRDPVRRASLSLGVLSTRYVVAAICLHYSVLRAPSAWPS